MIEAQELTRQFGDIVAVDSVSFKVNKGEIVGFLGLNGAGKTTTMRMLTSFIPPTSGKAIVSGFDVQTSSMEVRKKIGYLPERPPLYLDMTVSGYLNYVGKLGGVYPASKRTDYMNEAIDKCGLSKVKNRLICHLSKGFKQRVGLAQALIHKPEVLILDEPTSGLDPQQIIEIRNLIKDLANDHTILLSTHILPEVEMTCERVLVINNGKLITVGSISELSSEHSKNDQVYIELKKNSDAVIKTLEKIKPIINVEKSSDKKGYLINFKPGTGSDNISVDSRAEITKLVYEKKWGLIELKSLRPTLEDVFLKIIKEGK